ANLAALELHVSLSSADDPDTPDSIVFDLDPGPPSTLLDCIPIAITVRDMLAEIGLKSFAKTSGGKGLNLYVPLNTPTTYDQTKTFANAIASVMSRDNPKHVTAVMARNQRAGKIFIDWSQNDRGKTTVCVYSLRAREHPTVS